MPETIEVKPGDGEEPFAPSGEDRNTNTDPEYLPLATANAIARTWERLLDARHPGTRWTVTFDPED